LFLRLGKTKRTFLKLLMWSRFLKQSLQNRGTECQMQALRDAPQVKKISRGQWLWWI